MISNNGVNTNYEREDCPIYKFCTFADGYYK